MLLVYYVLMIESQFITNSIITKRIIVDIINKLHNNKAFTRGKINTESLTTWTLLQHGIKNSLELNIK